MKECPKCHKQYDDSMNFCLDDGTKLVAQELGVKPQPAPQPVAQPKPQPAPQSNPQPQPVAQPKARPVPPPVVQPKPQPQPVAQPKPQPAPQPKVPKVLTPAQKKRRKMVWIIIAVVLLAAGAGAGYYFMANAATRLGLNPANVEMGKKGGTAKVAIDYDGYMWSVASSPEWVETSKDGDELLITITPNGSGTSRMGSVVVESGSQSATVELSQSAYATVLTPSVTALEFGREGGTQTFMLETDGTNPTFSNPDFITIDRRGDTVIVKAAANTGDSRNGFILLSEDKMRTQVTVEQLGACPTCHGEGKVSCPGCNGTGKFSYGRSRVRCVGCAGTGKIDCTDCDGKGEV